MKNMKTVREIAAAYGVTTQAVHFWVKEGLPYKEDKKTAYKKKLFEPAKVQDWLDAKYRKVPKGDL